MPGRGSAMVSDDRRPMVGAVFSKLEARPRLIQAAHASHLRRTGIHSRVARVPLRTHATDPDAHTVSCNARTVICNAHCVTMLREHFI